MNAGLTTIEQATYLGGSGTDNGLALAIHPTSDEVYVAGDTLSADFLGTTGGAQAALVGSSNAFVARLNGGLTELKRATYLGGRHDTAYALAIHPTSGDVYVAGNTDSTNFAGTPGGAQAALNGGNDVFVARLNAALTTIKQAIYLGGSGFEDASETLAIHPTSGEVYVAGLTFSADFPGTAGGAQAAFGGRYDAFVARLTADLTAGPAITPVPRHRQPIEIPPRGK